MRQNNTENRYSRKAYSRGSAFLNTLGFLVQLGGIALELKGGFLDGGLASQVATEELVIGLLSCIIFGPGFRRAASLLTRRNIS